MTGASRSRPRLALTALRGELAVCRLGADEPVPEWAASGGFVSVTRTPDELSIVCDESSVPAGVRREGGWRALRVRGPISFETTGVLASIAAPLAEAGISLFALSTFDTDYVLVRARDLDRAIDVLRAAGHIVDEESGGALGG